MFKNSKIKKNFINLTLIFFSIVIVSYILSAGKPFLSLYNSGLDSILEAVIKSETSDRIKELIISVDREYFKVMIGFFFFLLMIFFFIKFKKNYFFK